MTDYLKIAREVMRERQIGLRPEADKPLEAVLRGQAIELWDTRPDAPSFLKTVDGPHAKR
jgi:hypothetical protein